MSSFLFTKGDCMDPAEEVSNLVELGDEIIMARMASLACNKAEVENLPLEMLDSQELIIQAYVIEKVRALRPFIVQKQFRSPEFFFNRISENVVEEILGLDVFLKTAASIDMSFIEVFDSFSGWSDILYGVQWGDYQSNKDRRDTIKDAREKASLQKHLQESEDLVEIEEEIKDQYYLLYDWHDQVKGIGKTFNETGQLVEPISDYYAPLTFQPKPRWYHRTSKAIKDNQNGLLIGSAIGVMTAFSIWGLVAYTSQPVFGPEFWEPMTDNSEFNQLLSRLE